jgi:hypothetical protein
MPKMAYFYNILQNAFSSSHNFRTIIKESHFLYLPDSSGPMQQHYCIKSTLRGSYWKINTSEHAQFAKFDVILSKIAFLTRHTLKKVMIRPFLVYLSHRYGPKQHHYYIKSTLRGSYWKIITS